MWEIADPSLYEQVEKMGVKDKLSTQMLVGSLVVNCQYTKNLKSLQDAVIDRLVGPAWCTERPNEGRGWVKKLSLEAKYGLAIGLYNKQAKFRLTNEAYRITCPQSEQTPVSTATQVEELYNIISNYSYILFFF